MFYLHKAFRKANLDVCPSCGGNEFELELATDAGTHQVEARCRCLLCDAAWIDVYEYKHTVVND